MSITTYSLSEWPNQWDEGFPENIKLQNGETPFVFLGKWYIYVYDKDIKDFVVYNYRDDIFISYREFKDFMDLQLIQKNELTIEKI